MLFILKCSELAMLNYILRKKQLAMAMILLLTLLFTISICTKETHSKTNCLDFKCEPHLHPRVVCVKITEPRRSIFQPMYRCAAQKFKCNVGDQLNLTLVSMTKCHKMTRPMRQRRLKREISNSIGNNSKTGIDSDQQNQERCPKACPAAGNAMVCARYGNLYRSFLSDCYMRMYECRNPREKMELVARRACYALGPLLDGMPSPEKEIDQPSTNDDLRDPVLDYIDNRTDEGFHKLQRYTPPRQVTIEKAPKPTVDVPWLTRPKKTRSKTTKSRRTRSTKSKSTITTTLTDEVREANEVEQKPSSSNQPTSGEATTTPVYDEPDVSFKKGVQFTVNKEDYCEDSEEADTPIDVPDVCPSSTIDNILTTERKYFKMAIHPDQVEDLPPVWTVWNHGTDVTTRARADAGVVLGCEIYAGVDFSGNIMVDSLKDSDFIGLVFGYRSDMLFYLVTWKATSAKYWIGHPFVARADAGIHIKLVNSSTGPGPELRNSIFNTESVEDQVTLLWQDPNKYGWKHKKRYTWRLIHRPHIGLIRIKVFLHQDLVLDSGNVYDYTILGGRIGLFTFSQEEVQWTRMSSKCNDKIPSNVMSELPPDLQKKSVVDSNYVF